MSPFDLMNIIFEKKPIPSDEDLQKYVNQYMMNMILSCDKQFVGVAHEMSKMKISNKMYFDCLYHSIPKGKRFIKYNAAKAKVDQDIQYLMDYFRCSQQRAKEYVKVIADDEMKKIREIYEKRGIK